MSYRVLFLISPATDPSVYRYALEKSQDIQGVDCVTGDTREGIEEAKSAFKNGYSVVGTDLLLSHSDISTNMDTYQAQVELAGFRVIQEGLAVGFSEGFAANYVVLSSWDNPTNVFEAYRLGARAFISRKVSLGSDEFVNSFVMAAKSEHTYPNMNPSVRNIAIALRTNDLRQLTIGELQIVDLIVNDQSTAEIKNILSSVSLASTTQRISKICRKLGLQNREAVAEYAINAGMNKHQDVQPIVV